MEHLQDWQKVALSFVVGLFAQGVRQLRLKSPLPLRRFAAEIMAAGLASSSAVALFLDQGQSLNSFLVFYGSILAGWVGADLLTYLSKQLQKRLGVNGNGNGNGDEHGK